MAKDTIMGVVNKLVDKRLNNLNITDIVLGTVHTLEPFSILILVGSNSIPIPEELIDMDVIPWDVEVGDRYRFIRYNDGQRFLMVPKRCGNRDYELLKNIPTINYIPHIGNRDVAEFPIWNGEMDDMLDNNIMPTIVLPEVEQPALVSGCGTKYYTQLINLPEINTVKHIGNRDLAEVPIEDEEIDYMELNNEIREFIFNLDIDYEENPYVSCCCEDYEELYELPSINGVTFIGNRNLATDPIVDLEVDAIMQM